MMTTTTTIGQMNISNEALEAYSSIGRFPEHATPDLINRWEARREESVRGCRVNTVLDDFLLPRLLVVHSGLDENQMRTLYLSYAGIESPNLSAAIRATPGIPRDKPLI